MINRLNDMFLKLGVLVEERLLIRRSVLAILTLLSGVYAAMGLWILANRPDGAITTDEAALIIAFAGVNGVAFSTYNKSRKP